MTHQMIYPKLVSFISVIRFAATMIAIDHGEDGLKNDKKEIATEVYALASKLSSLKGKQVSAVRIQQLYLDTFRENEYDNRVNEDPEAWEELCTRLHFLVEDGLHNATSYTPELYVSEVDSEEENES